MNAHVLLVRNPAHAVLVGKDHVHVPVHEPAAQLLHQRVARFAAGPYANLGRRVAAQHRTVVHERHLESAPGRRHGRATAGKATAYHYEIAVDRLRDGHGGRPQRDFWRGGVFREYHAGAASVESVQVHQANLYAALFQHHFAAVFPCPFALRRAECLVQLFAAHGHLERACAVNPFAGAHPYAPVPGFGHLGAGGRIENAQALAVRQQVGGTHHVRELHVKAPSAGVELLRRDLNRRGVQGCRHEQSCANTCDLHLAFLLSGWVVYHINCRRDTTFLWRDGGNKMWYNVGPLPNKSIFRRYLAQ